MTSTIQKPKFSKVRIWCFGCLLALTSIFIWSLACTGTIEFWDLSAIMAMLVALPVLLVTVLCVSVVFLIIGAFIMMIHLAPRTQRLILLAPWILASGFWICYAVATATPRSRFSSAILSPIPASARNIKAAGLNAFLARRWLLTFQIDANQIGDIVSKHSLVRTNYVDFQRMIDNDMLLKRIEWAHNIECPTNAQFYYRMETGAPGRWACLALDTNSSRAWFLSGYQN